MKRGSGLKRDPSPLALAIGFIMVFFISRNAVAGEIDWKFLAAANSVSVSIPGAPDNSFEYIRGQKIDTCRAVSNRREDIKNLIDTLRTASTREISPEKSFLPFFSVAIHFKYENGSEVQFVFGKEYPNEQFIDGEVILPMSSHPITFVADHTLLRKLLRWASQSKEVQVSNFNSSHKTQMDERTKSWIANDATRFGKDAEEEIKKRVELYKMIDEARKTRSMNYCSSVINTVYYRSSPNQICNPPEFYRPISDYCSLGWKTVH